MKNLEISATQQSLQNNFFRPLFLSETYMTLRKRESNILTCSLAPLPKPLRRKVTVGQLLTIKGSDKDVSGVIVTIHDTECKVYYTDDPGDSIDRIEWRNWWSFPISFAYLLNKKALIECTDESAHFKGIADVPYEETLHVKWSLFYEEEVFLNGVDWQKPGYCEVDLAGYKFKEGQYKFKAKRLNTALTKTLAEDEVSFNIDEPTASISIGTINSIYLPLSL